MATTCFIARSAENAVGGAFSGMAPGGRLTCSANTMQIATNKNAIASRSIVRCLIAGKYVGRHQLSTGEDVCNRRRSEGRAESRRCENSTALRRCCFGSLADLLFCYDVTCLR